MTKVLTPQDLEASFLRQYERAPQTTINCLTAGVAEMDAAISPMISACVRAGLPELTLAQRQTMAGQLTPEHRELALAVCDLLDRRDDLREELGLSAELFQDLLDRDIAIENFGAAASEVARALALGEALLGGTLSTLNARVLLAVQETLASLDPATQRAEHDRLLATFRAALRRYEELTGAPRSGGEREGGTLRSLQQQLGEARRSTAVLDAVEQLTRATATTTAAATATDRRAP